MIPWRPRWHAVTDTFSEFTYSFALVNELVTLGNPPVVSVPVFPSLIQEGRATGGYDVALDRPGRPLFLQFKLSKHIRGRRARDFQQGLFWSPFYRMYIRARRSSRQHELLLELERTNQGSVLADRVLGWGSLLWHQCGLQLSSRWHSDGPELPLEFARVSDDARLTLVLHEQSPRQKTYWAVGVLTTLDAVRENLRVREHCRTINPIHAMTRAGCVSGTVPERVRGVISVWFADHPDLDAVVWTGLGPKWTPSDAFSIDGAIAYLRALREPARSRAEEYLRKAPPQIQTPVRERARQELGWGDEPLPPDTLVEKCDAN
jgi:hypothetical protein